MAKKELKIENTNQIINQFKSAEEREAENNIKSSIDVEEVEKKAKEVKAKQDLRKTQLFFRTNQVIIDFVETKSYLNQISKQDYLNGLIISEMKRQFNISEDVSEEETIKQAEKELKKIKDIMKKFK